jgi:hypothetical protein
MKFKNMLVALLVGLVCLPSMSYGQDDIAALRQKAEQGDTEAQRQLGLAYYNGKGVPQDYKEAVRWYRLAADQGYAKAQFRLGWCYASGKGVPKDSTEAAKWYRLAAERGYATAQFRLGEAYDKGKGVPKDSTEAVKWYRLAAEQGNAPAQSNLTAKAEKLPPPASMGNATSEQGNAKAQPNPTNDLLATSPAAADPLPPPDEKEMRIDDLQASLNDLDGKVIKTSFNRVFSVTQMDDGKSFAQCCQHDGNGVVSYQTVVLPEAGKKFFQAVAKRGFGSSSREVYLKVRSQSPIRVRTGASSYTCMLEAVGTRYDTSENQYSW